MTSKPFNNGQAILQSYKWPSTIPTPVPSGTNALASHNIATIDILQVSDVFKGARNVAYIGAISLTVVLIILWPSAMTATGVLTLTNFKQWVCTFN